MQRYAMLLALILSAGALAADEPANDSVPAESTEASADRDAVPAEAAEKAPARPPSQTAAPASPQRFEPSEQVRADFDVSFPVDI
jgi:hypothetical protein